MKSKLLFVLLLLSSINTTAQSDLSGKWYLVTRNNYRCVEITSDSLFIHGTNGFSFELACGRLEADEHFLIRETKKSGDTLFCLIATDSLLPDTYIFYPDSINSNRSYFKLKKGNVEGPTLTLVNELELESYASLKNLDKMTEADFISFANEMDTLISESNKHSEARHFLYSEMKYILVELGYDPRLTIQEIGEKFKVFEQMENTKKHFDAVFRRKR